MITDYERFVAKRFVNLWNQQQGQNYMLLDGLDPPDFLLDAPSQKTWLEVTGIYMNEAQGKFRNCPTEVTFGYQNIDPAQTALRLIDQLNRKLSNRNYSAIFAERGKGVLLLTCEDCAFDAVNLARVDECLSGFQPSTDLGFFNIAYFEYCLGESRFYGEVYPQKDLPTSAFPA